MFSTHAVKSPLEVGGARSTTPRRFEAVHHDERKGKDASSRPTLRSILARWLLVTHVAVMIGGILAILIPPFCIRGTDFRLVQPWIRSSVYGGAVLVGMGVLVSIARSLVED